MVHSNLELILELKTAIIIVSGDPWSVRAYNQVASEWFGSALKEGVELATIIPSVNERGLKRRLSKGRAADFDVDIQLERHLPVEFVCTQTTQYDEGVILEGHDLTRAHSAELMLSSYSSMIEEKTKELEAAVHARDQFFSTMSHELRTPLNSIIGFTEALIDEVYGEFSDEQLAILEKVYWSGQNLMSLLTNLLYLSRIRSGKLQLSLREVDLSQICRAAIAHQEERAEAKEIRISMEIDSEACCQPKVDTDLCQQMIEHLLNNAIKFSAKGTQVLLSVKKRFNTVRVTVSDQGIGIAREHFVNIFQPFTQVETSLARAYEGSGLGLSVVSEVIRLHGGRVSVESQLGIGSQFHLDFVCDN